MEGRVSQLSDHRGTTRLIYHLTALGNRRRSLIYQRSNSSSTAAAAASSGTLSGDGLVLAL